MTTFEVDQVAYNDRDGSGVHEVQVTLSQVQYRQLVGDLIRRLRSMDLIPPLEAVGGLAAQDDLTYWMALVPPRPSWRLGTEEALALGLDLREACEEPASCASCGLFVERPSSLRSLCASCDEASTRRGGPRG